jgi:hypothetical protein
MKPEPEHCFTGAGSFGVTLNVTTADGCAGTVTLEDIITVAPSPDPAISVQPAVALIDDPVFSLHQHRCWHHQLVLGSGCFWQ